jgi:hypothetical protein
MDAKSDMAALVDEWIISWNQHDLKGVLRPMAENVVFEHWNGRVIRGKRQLELAWRPWFEAHGNFRFDVKGICVDQTNQKLSFEWQLEWPSPEPAYTGQQEIREGLDLIEMQNGLIIAKRSYTKTVLTIAGRAVLLKAV